MPPDLDHAHLFTSRYGAPWPTLLAACLSRATTLEWRRNWPAAVVRWLLALVISIVAGSIFWRLPATFEGAVSAMGMLFWVLSFILVITVPTVELTYQRRPVVLRQRTNRFYAGWMEAVPQVLVNLPILAGDVIAVGAPVYWMVGFYPGAGRFFGFLAVLLGANVTADNFYRLLGAVMPNMHVGVAVGVTIYVAMELLAGARGWGAGEDAAARASSVRVGRPADGLSCWPRVRAALDPAAAAPMPTHPLPAPRKPAPARQGSRYRRPPFPSPGAPCITSTPSPTRTAPRRSTSCAALGGPPSPRRRRSAGRPPR